MIRDESFVEGWDNRAKNRRDREGRGGRKGAGRERETKGLSKYP